MVLKKLRTAVAAVVATASKPKKGAWCPFFGHGVEGQVESRRENSRGRQRKTEKRERG